MKSDSRAIALAFAGTITGLFALIIAVLCADGVPAIGLLVMTVFCAADFVCRLDFDVAKES